MTFTMTSTFWYEIFYPDGTSVIFQFLDISAEGRHRCRLCDGEETLDVFRTNYSRIIEHGEVCPC
jgi:hypothetical protein